MRPLPPSIVTAFAIPFLIAGALHAADPVPPPPPPAPAAAPGAPSPAPPAPAPGQPLPPPAVATPAPAPVPASGLPPICAEKTAKGEPLPPECQPVAAPDISFRDASAITPDARAAQVRDDEYESLNRKNLVPPPQAERARVSEAPSLWTIARQEPSLFGDGEKEGAFAAAIGFSSATPIGRGGDMGKAYGTGFNAHAELSHQLLPLFEIALAADFQWLPGRNVATKAPYNLGTVAILDDVGVMLDPWMGLGAGPVFRLDLHPGDFDIAIGAGLGWHWYSTSGRGRIKRPFGSDVSPWEGVDEASFGFETSDHGFFGSLEASVMYRFWLERLGVGVSIQYLMPLHDAIGGLDSGDLVFEDDTETEVAGVERFVAYDTLVRNLGALSLFNAGLVAEARF